MIKRVVQVPEKEFDAIVTFLEVIALGNYSERLIRERSKLFFDRLSKLKCLRKTHVEKRD